MIYQDNVEGLAVWLPWDAGETEILAIRDASPVMRQILAELSRQLLVATTYHQGPRAADQPPAFAPFQSLDYIKTPEDLEEYVQARIADQPDVIAWCARCQSRHELGPCSTPDQQSPCPQCGMTEPTMCRRLDCKLNWGGLYPVAADPKEVNLCGVLDGYQFSRPCVLPYKHEGDHRFAAPADNPSAKATPDR
jgi:hypothetical protein